MIGINIHTVVKAFVLSVFLVSISMAKIHPGLKNAVDNGNVKEAKILIEKIGVQDIYCPANLSFDDAYQLYGKVFEEDPSKMWENCDSLFLKNTYSVVCKKSVPLCKMLLHKISVFDWKPYLEDILNNSLYLRKEKRKELKEERVKTTKKECMLDLEAEKAAARISVTTLKSAMCDPKDEASQIICPLLFAAIEDSIRKAHNAMEKICKTKPTKSVKKEMEFEVETNPFLYEIEFYGGMVASEMQIPLPFDEKELELYRKLKKNAVAERKSLNEVGYEITKSHLNGGNVKYEKVNLVHACIAFPGIDTLLNKSSNFRINGYSVSCEKEWEKHYVNKAFLLTSPKAVLMKELVSMYAKTGKISDSYVAYSCRLDPNIDKELYKLTEINILDCGEIKRKYEKYVCNENFQDSLVASEHGVYYICDGDRWFYASLYESKFGLCIPKKFGKIETYDGNEKIICDSIEHNWRKATAREVDLYQQSCDANEPGKIVKPCGDGDCEGRSYVCENGTWRRDRDYESLLGVCNDKVNNDSIKKAHIDYVHCNQGMWRRIWRKKGAVTEYGMDSLNLVGKVVNRNGIKMVIDEFGKSEIFRPITEMEKRLKKTCVATNFEDVVEYKGEKFVCWHELKNADSRSVDPQKYLKLWVPLNTGTEALPVGDVLWTVERADKGCNGKWKIPSSADYKKLFQRNIFNHSELYGRELGGGGMRLQMKTSDGLWVDEKENKISDRLPSGYLGSGNRCVLY